MHEVDLGYPPELIEHAERMAGHVLDGVRSGVEPFAGSVALEWMARRTS